ncbi:MAG: hypothetical protein KF861_09645 [Planctomycetaceae bacterium]|nr:hypothetical protein [Planctomycetaceae bacterium]
MPAPLKWLGALVTIQIAMILLILLGDIGFDRAGKYGFDFGHLLLFSATYLLALAWGVVYAILKKRFGIAALQLAIPLSIVAWESRPYPQYRAAELQHLVGADKAAVEAELGTRGRVTSNTTRRGALIEFWCYDGVEVVFSPTGRVQAVNPYIRWEDGYRPEAGSVLNSNAGE